MGTPPKLFVAGYKQLKCKIVNKLGVDEPKTLSLSLL